MIDVKEEMDKFYSLPWSARWRSAVEIDDMIGKTIVAIDGAEADSEAIIFLCNDGSRYVMYHEQDCCESVTVNDVCGDISQLIGEPILKAECVTNSDEPAKPDIYEAESWTWTFYHLATVKGYVTIRWYGESNGYYSECVDLIKLVERSELHCLS